MEIPPISSFAQATSYFSDLSEQEIRDSILNQTPYSAPNIATESSNRKVALTVTGEKEQFKEKDFIQANKLFQGRLQYPFQSIAQITNNKFDPYYLDGSESVENFNVQENLIGTPMGAGELEDPRLTMTRSLLHLKEYQGQSSLAYDGYIKNLYTVNTEKGSTYYQEQIHRELEKSEDISRKGRKRRYQPMNPLYFSGSTPMGETSHKRRYNTQEKNVIMSSITPVVQSDYNRHQMNLLDTRIVDQIQFQQGRLAGNIP